MSTAPPVPDGPAGNASKDRDFSIAFANFNKFANFIDLIPGSQAAPSLSEHMFVVYVAARTE